MKTENWQIPKNKLALEIKNLTKIYQGENEHYALDDVSLNVKAGSIFGLDFSYYWTINFWSFTPRITAVFIPRI